MDKQEQVVEARRRRSRAEAGQLVVEYEASGLSRTEFCRERGLSLATLARYRKRQWQAQSEAAGGNRWVAVELCGAGRAVGSGTGSGLSVALSGGRRIDVGCGFDARTLMQLLSVLERF